MLPIYWALLQDSRDEPIFEEFYNKYNKTVYYIAKEKLGTHDQAEDCVQETFFRFAKNFHNIKVFLKDYRIEGLVKVIARNTAIDIYRKNRRYYANVANADLSDFYSISDNVFDECDQMVLKDAIESLPEEIKITFYLKYVYGYSGKEIAQLLCVTESLVRKRCMIGRQLAQKYIERGKNE